MAGKPRTDAAAPIGIAICTLDRAGPLARTLDAIRHLRTRPSQTLVVAGPSRDGTSAVLARHAGRIETLDCAEANLARARNLALARARTPLLAFLDDDAVPEPDWLCRLREPFASPDVAAVGGPIRDRSGIGWQCRVVLCDEMARLRQLDEFPATMVPGEQPSLTGAGFAVRVAAARAVGGFDEAYAYYLEETDLQRRLALAGWRLAFAPDAEVHHGFAPNAQRTAERVPLDLAPVARSLAYFCLRHGADGPGPAFEARIEQHREREHLRIQRHLRRGRIDRAEMRRLEATLVRGLAEGRRRAAEQPSLPFLAEHEPAVDMVGDSLRSDPLLPDPLLPDPLRADSPRRRLAILAPAGSAASRRGILRLARALGALGHEVTLVLRPRPRGAVSFARGVWRHHPGPAQPRRRLLDQALAVGITPARAIVRGLGELERVEPRRRFECVLVMAELPGPAVLLDALPPTGEHASVARALLALARGAPAVPLRFRVAHLERPDPVAVLDLLASARPVAVPVPLG